MYRDYILREIQKMMQMLEALMDMVKRDRTKEADIQLDNDLESLYQLELPYFEVTEPEKIIELLKSRVISLDKISLLPDFLELAAEIRMKEGNKEAAAALLNAAIYIHEYAASADKNYLLSRDEAISRLKEMLKLLESN